MLIGISGSTAWAYEGQSVEPMPWNPPQNRADRGDAKHRLLSNPDDALKRRLVDLGQRAVRSTADDQPRVGPTRIGYPRNVEQLKVRANTQAQLGWRSFDGGLLGSLAIRSGGASAVRLGMQVGSVPDLAEFRFFSSQNMDGILVTGKAIMESVRANLAAGDPVATATFWWSPPIEGESAGLEIFLPPGTSEDALQIAIPTVSHLFTLPTAAAPTLHPQSASDFCELDSTCYPDWLNVSKSVAKISFVDGGASYICTGTLLNDEAADAVPYFLTANHCVNTQTVASSLIAYWFYYASSCNSGVVSPLSTTTRGGGALLYHSSSTDTSFLRLNTAPPSGVIFSGWTTATPSLAQASTGLHNPRGDLQKISFGRLLNFQNCTDVGSSSFNCVTTNSAVGSYLEIGFTRGVTEPGSSGSGIFVDSSKYLYGQLYGGDDSCQNPSGTSTYGRFDKAFANGNLGQWLSVPKISYSLGVTNNGHGTVTSSPAGILCGASCTGSFNAGTSVTLTATPDSGYRFSGWSGSCTGTDPCVLNMTQNQSVSATFQTVSYTLEVQNQGNGAVTSSPEGINCGSMCSYSWSAGTTVTLQATPNAGYRFMGWSGGCTGMGTCVLTMSQNQRVSASFQPQSYTLDVQNQGNGVVTSLPSGISCGLICTSSWSAGSVVNLQATPNPGYRFNGWSGACSGEESCQVSMNSNQSVSANFSSLPVLNVDSTGGGTITSAPQGIQCGTNCSATYAPQTAVTLTAIPDSGFGFAGWTGACGGKEVCAVTMNGNQGVSAVFSKLPNLFRKLTVTRPLLGVITSSDARIACGIGARKCSSVVQQGSTLMLTASPKDGYVTGSWTGCTESSGDHCKIEVGTRPIRVVAKFVRSP